MEIQYKATVCIYHKANQPAVCGGGPLLHERGIKSGRDCQGLAESVTAVVASSIYRHRIKHVQGAMDSLILVCVFILSVNGCFLHSEE